MLIAVILLAVAALAFYIATRNNSSVLSEVEGGTSAFAKLADADVKRREAEGKIIAVKAAAEAHQAVASELKQGALEAHAALDESHKALDEVHDLLG